MFFYRIKNLLFVVAIIGFATFKAAASDFSIAALVNDQIISALDLDSRIKMVFGTSNIPYNQETINHFKPQILNQMIDDLLKIQAAKDLGINITDDDIENAIATVERNNRMPKGQLKKMVESFGISQETLRMQMKSEISWLKIAGKLFMPNTNVSDEEVKDFIDKKKAHIGKPEMMVSEIFLPIDDVDKEEEVLTNARRIIGYVASGVDFGAMAKQFSQSPTAGSGGDLGWIYEGQLEKELDEVINKMEPPSISSPIKTRYGYYILLLKDKRLASIPDPSKAVYNLSQIYIPDSTLDVIKQDIMRKANNAENCSAFNEVAKNFGTLGSGPLGMIPLANMPPEILKATKDLPENKAGGLTPVKDGNLIFMVCSKTIPGGLPDEKTVRNQLELEKIDKMARRKLRELRRLAIIEIR
ncbi:MAG: peptidylprolyl isomerase [Alphaproteobacteria bacterium]